MIGSGFIDALTPATIWRFVETTMNPRGSDLRQQTLSDSLLVFRNEAHGALWFQDLEDHTASSLPVAFAAKARYLSPDTWAMILEPEDFDRLAFDTEISDPYDKTARRWLKPRPDGSFPPSGHPFPVHMTWTFMGTYP